MVNIQSKMPISGVIAERVRARYAELSRPEIGIVVPAWICGLCSDVSFGDGTKTDDALDAMIIVTAWRRCFTCLAMNPELVDWIARIMDTHEARFHSNQWG